MQQIKWRDAKKEIPEFIKYKQIVKGKEVELSLPHSYQCLIIFNNEIRSSQWCINGFKDKISPSWNFLTKKQSEQVTHWCYLKDIIIGDLA